MYGGTLIQTSATALPAETDLTISGGGTLIFDPSQSAGLMAEHASLGVTAVPEPGTLVLLIAGAAVAFGLWRRRLRSIE